MTTVASCGCTLQATDRLIEVEYRSEHCDATQGIVPCRVHAVFCPPCVARLVLTADFISAHAVEDSAV